MKLTEMLGKFVFHREEYTANGRRISKCLILAPQLGVFLSAFPAITTNSPMKTPFSFAPAFSEDLLRIDSGCGISHDGDKGNFLIGGRRFDQPAIGLELQALH